jgi:pimeloyl-ACP methyl ester carboxylesterase
LFCYQPHGWTHPARFVNSIAGEELSSVASRHPDRVAGLIYLDAAYGYAFYDPSRGHFDIDLVDLQRKLEQLQMGKGPADTRPLIRELLETDLPKFERNLIRPTCVIRTGSRCVLTNGELARRGNSVEVGHCPRRESRPVRQQLFRFPTGPHLIPPKLGESQRAWIHPSLLRG